MEVPVRDAVIYETYCVQHGVHHRDFQQIVHGVESLIYHASFHGHPDEAQRLLGLLKTIAGLDYAIAPGSVFIAAQEAARRLLAEVGSIRRNPLLVLDERVNGEVWDPNKEPTYRS